MMPSFHITIPVRLRPTGMQRFWLMFASALWAVTHGLAATIYTDQPGHTLSEHWRLCGMTPPATGTCLSRSTIPPQR